MYLYRPCVSDPCAGWPESGRLLEVRFRMSFLSGVADLWSAQKYQTLQTYFGVFFEKNRDPLSGFERFFRGPLMWLIAPPCCRSLAKEYGLVKTQAFEAPPKWPIISRPCGSAWRHGIFRFPYERASLVAFCASSIESRARLKPSRPIHDSLYKQLLGSGGLLSFRDALHTEMVTLKHS